MPCPVPRTACSFSEHFGEAPYFLLLTLKCGDGRVLNESWLTNPFIGVEKGKGIQVSEWLVSLGVDEVITAKSFAHKGPSYVFSEPWTCAVMARPATARRKPSISEPWPLGSRRSISHARF